MEQNIHDEIARLVRKQYKFSLFSLGASALASCLYIYFQKASYEYITFILAIVYFALFVIGFFVEKYFREKLKIDQEVLAALAKKESQSLNFYFEEPMEEIQDGFPNRTAAFFFTTLTFFFFAIGEKFVQGSLWIKENIKEGNVEVEIEVFKPEYLLETLVYVLVLAVPIWLAYITLSDVARGAKIKNWIKRVVAAEKKKLNPEQPNNS